MDKPLHVKVAEALGWTETEKAGGLSYWGRDPATGRIDYASDIPRYDTDWAATGPLIERLSIHVFKSLRGWHAAQDASWITLGLAEPPHETPLLAVCNLILQLHAAGKLVA